MRIDDLPAAVSIDEIVAAIEKAGYGAILPEEGREGEDVEQIARQAEIRNQTRKFIVGVIFALPLFVLSMMRDFSLIGAWSHAVWVNWLFAGLATPVQFYTGWDYYVGGFKSIRNKCQHGRAHRARFIGCLFLFADHIGIPAAGNTSILKPRQLLSP